MLLPSKNSGYRLRVLDMLEHILRAITRQHMFDVWQPPERGKLWSEASCGAKEEKEKAASIG